MNFHLRRLGSIDEQRCLSYVYSLTTSFNNGALRMYHLPSFINVFKISFAYRKISVSYRPLAILRKSLDRAKFLYNVTGEVPLTGVRVSITVRKFFKMYHIIVRFRFFFRIGTRSIGIDTVKTSFVKIRLDFNHNQVNSIFCIYLSKRNNC